MNVTFFSARKKARKGDKWRDKGIERELRYGEKRKRLPIWRSRLERKNVLLQETKRHQLVEYSSRAFPELTSASLEKRFRTSCFVITRDSALYKMAWKKRKWTLIVFAVCERKHFAHLNADVPPTASYGHHRFSSSKPHEAPSCFSHSKTSSY